MSSRIPRLPTEEMLPELSAFLAPRVQRLGYLGEFFQCTAHQPEALLSFLEFTEHLKHALPDRLTEVVVLSVAVMLKSDYERIQHERLCVKLGFDPEWIDAVESLCGKAPTLTREEQVVQQFTLVAVQRNGHDTVCELESMIDVIGVERAIAVMMLIGRYISHSLIVNSLNLSPPYGVMADPLPSTAS
jgi:alkylhydroperoxidase family enzyme